MRLSRKQKIVRNLMACGLLTLLLYILLGCPPLTVRGMLARTQRDYLLPELEEVYVIKSRYQANYDLIRSRYTFIFAQAGEEYVSFGYRTHLLDSKRDVFRDVKLQKSALCVAGGMTVYVVSEKLREADSAVALVETSPAQYTAAADQPNGGTYTLEGERLNEQMFTFSYAGTELTMGLGAWYQPDTVPVTVMLYDADGGVLDTLFLEVGAHELKSVL